MTPDETRQALELWRESGVLDVLPLKWEQGGFTWRLVLAAGRWRVEQAGYVRDSRCLTRRKGRELTHLEALRQLRQAATEWLASHNCDVTWVERNGGVYIWFWESRDGLDGPIDATLIAAIKRMKEGKQ